MARAVHPHPHDRARARVAAAAPGEVLADDPAARALAGSRSRRMRSTNVAAAERVVGEVVAPGHVAGVAARRPRQLACSASAGAGRARALAVELAERGPHDRRAWWRSRGRGVGGRAGLLGGRRGERASAPRPRRRARRRGMAAEGTHHGLRLFGLARPGFVASRPAAGYGRMYEGRRVACLPPRSSTSTARSSTPTTTTPSRGSAPSASTASCCPLWRIHRHIGMGGDHLVAALCGDEVEEEKGDDIRAAEKALYVELIEEVEPLEGAARADRRTQGPRPRGGAGQLGQARRGRALPRPARRPRPGRRLDRPPATSRPPSPSPTSSGPRWTRRAAARR